MSDEIKIGDQVAHRGSGRAGLVLDLGRRWYGLEIALVQMRDPGGALVNRTVPVKALRKGGSGPIMT